MKYMLVGAARPNFMKIAPIIRAFKKKNVDFTLVHTGQHYDKNMSQAFFDDLGMPKPDYNLGIGSGSHAHQTGNTITKFGEVLEKEAPDYVVVVGDVNATIACALTAIKMGIKVAHVEAGLRSGDKTMPEEVNRILTDHISDYLFVTEKSGIENLKKEGIPQEKIFFVGNTMIDTLLHQLPEIKKKSIPSHLKEKEYTVMTMHRPKNVDDKKDLLNLLDLVQDMSAKQHVVWPLHPRTKNNLEKNGLSDNLKNIPNVTLTEPLGYQDFLNLVMNSGCVVTDSGGIQEETTYLGVPCVTLRENTERPVTITKGTNTMATVSKDTVGPLLDSILEENYKQGSIPELWDGDAATRIVDHLTQNEN